MELEIRAASLIGFNRLLIPFDITQVGSGSPGLLGARLLSLWTSPVPQPSRPSCLPSPSPGAAETLQALPLESAQSGSPGEGARSRQCLAWGGMPWG